MTGANSRLDIGQVLKPETAKSLMGVSRASRLHGKVSRVSPWVLWAVSFGGFSMPKKRPPPTIRSRATRTAPDVDQSDDVWAGELVAAIGKREARRILGDYRRLARDPALSQFDRNVASSQAKALARLL